MVDEGLDVGSNQHLFVLHHLFKGRINQELQAFKKGWNNHSLSSEHHYTPMQLIEINITKIPNDVNPIEGDDEVDEILDPDEVPQVQVEPLHCPFTPGQLQYFKERCMPLTLEDSPESLYDKYMCALEFSYLVLAMHN